MHLVLPIVSATATVEGGLGQTVGLAHCLPGSPDFDLVLLVVQ